MTKAEHEESKRITDAATSPPWLYKECEEPSDSGDESFTVAELSVGEGQRIASYDSPTALTPANLRWLKHARTALPAYQQALEEAMELIRAWASQGESSGEPCTCCWCIPHHANCTAANLLKQWDGDERTNETILR